MFFSVEMKIIPIIIMLPVLGPGTNSHDVLKAASRLIHSKFNFFEMTLQIEDFQEGMKDCSQCQCPEK